MQILLLGTAAGGGFPQWNCWCPGCSAARTDPSVAWPRTQSSAAISADGRHWFLLNASPDVREQIARLPVDTRDSARRRVPIEGVVLTDAELDHSLGLVLLREARELRVYATAAVAGILEDDSHILPVTQAFADVAVTNLHLDVAVPLVLRSGAPSGLTVTAFAVPADPPRFAPGAGEGHTVGLIVDQPATGKSCAFVPGCGDLAPDVVNRLRSADAVLFDGTFWTDDELVTLDIGTRTAREMDHLPVSGPGGSLEGLSKLPARHRVYTHINNTNPMLVEASPERATVVAAGLTVGFDGLLLTLD